MINVLISKSDSSKFAISYRRYKKKKKTEKRNKKKARKRKWIEKERKIERDEIVCRETTRRKQ